MNNAMDDPIPWDDRFPSQPPPRPGLWRSRGYRWLWLASGLAATAYGITFGSRISLWDEVDFSTRWMTTIGLAEGIGLLLGYVIAAFIADRRSKRSLTLGTVTAMGVLAAFSAVLGLFGQFGPETFVAIAALFGIARGLLFVTLLGWICELLPRRLIAMGIVVLTFAELPLGFVAALSPVLLADRDQAVVWYFAAGGALYLLALLVARRAPLNATPVDIQVSASPGLRGAIRYLRRDDRLRTLWIYGFVVGAGLAALQFTLTSFQNDIGLSISEVAVSWIAWGGAGFLATIALMFLISGSRIWHLLFFFAALLGLTGLALAFATNQPLLILVIIPYGAAVSFVSLATRALAMSSVRSGYFGRITAVLAFTGGIISYLLPSAGAFASTITGERWIIVAIGGLLFAAAIWLFSRWRRFRHLPDDPDRADPAPMMPLLADVAAPQKASEQR